MPELLRSIATDTSTLLRKEMELGRQEIVEAVTARLKAAGSMAAVGVLALFMLVFLGWFVFPGTLWYGLPSAHTFHAITRALSEVGQQTRVQVAPTQPLKPLLMAAATAMWTAAFSTHALALRSGSPLLAAVPCAALLAFAGIVVGDGPRRGYAALFLFGLLAVLVVDGLRRVRQWGPLRPWQGTSRPRVTSTTTTRGARRVAFAAVIVALLVPGILPGFRAAPLLATMGNGGPGPEVDPLVSVTASLKRGKAIPLFSVRATQGVYWRWMGLDSFDGTTWSTSDLDLHRGTLVGSGDTLPEPSPTPLSTAQGDVQPLTQNVHVINSPGQWLPMAYAPLTVSLPQGEVRYDPDISAARPTFDIGAGLDYSVTSLVPKPSFDQLDKLAGFGGVSRYTQLPAETRREILPIVRTVLAAAGHPSTPVRKVLAIENYFTSSGHFVYDTSVAGRHDTKTLVRFLTTTHRGFCQQFATSMAVMLRSIGIPARVAVGFTEGTPNPKTDTYLVTTANAHSWVEVLFPQYGWIPFEPTPNRSNPITGHILSGAQHKGGQFIGGSGSNTGSAGNRKNGSIIRVRDPDSGRFRHTPVSDPGRGAGAITPPPHSYTGLVLLVMAILIGGAAVGIPAWKMTWRRRELRRAREPREAVLAAYRVFSSLAADVGLGRSHGETMAEYSVALQRYQAGRGILVEALDALATRTRAQTNVVQALYDYNVAQDQLRRAVGQPEAGTGRDEGRGMRDEG